MSMPSPAFVFRCVVTSAPRRTVTRRGLPGTITEVMQVVRPWLGVMHPATRCPVCVYCARASGVEPDPAVLETAWRAVASPECFLLLGTPYHIPFCLSNASAPSDFSSGAAWLGSPLPWRLGPDGGLVQPAERRGIAVSLAEHRICHHDHHLTLNRQGVNLIPQVFLAGSPRPGQAAAWPAWSPRSAVASAPRYHASC